MESENKLKRLIIHPDLIPAENRIKRPIHQRRILIDGELEVWNGPVHQVFSPVYLRNTDNSSAEESQMLIGSYPLATSKEAELALNAAVKAYNGGRGPWPSMPVQKRIRCLDVFTKKMVQRKDEIVNLIMWEIGKSSADAEKEFDRTIEYIQDTVRAAKKLNNSTSAFQVQQNFIGQTKKLPYGVVLCMGPFNYPLNETFTTLIPALIMGNTILFKPPKHGTLLFEPLLEAFWEAFPKGVVNTVYGRGRDTVPFLMQSGKVDVLALIGSSKVADSLKKMHPKSNRLKSVLGLDAKNAAIVMDDAELDLTVKECISGALSFNGQRCTALKILFVHTDIADRFNKRLVEEVDKLAIGMPWTAGVAITPLAEPEKPRYLQECLEDAVEHGATILNTASGGGSAYKSLMKPAIVYPVNEAMKLYREEQFGPIIPIVPFDDVEIPVDYITESSFGQQVSIFSRDSEDIGLLIDLLAGQVGRININSQCQRSPDTFAFNGRKDSAEGTLSVEEALHAFSVDSVVSTRQTAFNQAIIDDILVNHKSNRLSHTVAL
ncbi:NADP-dependent glyceraldehyde-3-phosphate dehydrogenase [Pontibacter silvestris]|uniref:NADP-dependent glyceraldehyde-3-phosphate dehydrogenase n=1 Tax=Pontibacter silvestris TaxID=2305183 RepID=A0ABW4X3H9_9BACT|nr:NADP-dependent glyceraldehyde-3-phosphate dehydrogenase [Pontibacter silvestris]MCC9138664.1 NADP-dependent glyceraldehyde-3-phosphate dehydrogenase [Pontibacter silvestris]